MCAPFRGEHFKPRQKNLGRSSGKKLLFEMTLCAQSGGFAETCYHF